MSIVQSAMDRIKKGNTREPAARSGTLAAEEILDPTSRTRLPQPALGLARLPLVNLDIEKLRAVRLYPAKQHASKQTDEYRGIRREVLTASREKIAGSDQTIGPIIVVTSALPGDGKSYTALNLALCIAGENVNDVLLIDADTVRHTLSSACGVSDRPGLLDLLGNPEASFLDYVSPTTMGRLHVMSAGIRHEAAGDLLSAGRIGPLFQAIRAAMTGHVVIVDTAPILVSSETQVFTDSAGQVLLVVHAGRSLQDSVKEAVARIRESVPVGVVLNAWVPTLPSEKKAYSAYYEYMK